MKRQTKQQRIEQLEAQVSQLQRDAQLFGERLNEARRRTVPMSWGDKDINFLPLSISKVDMKQDIKQFSSASGERFFASGRSTAIITCDGDVVMSPNQSQPAEPAKPKAPEKPNGKPDHALGWLILNEFADKIKDQTAANLFISDARPLEQGFTGGYLSENQYRIMLTSLLPR